MLFPEAIITIITCSEWMGFASTERDFSVLSGQGSHVLYRIHLGHQVFFKRAYLSLCWTDSDIFLHAFANVPHSEDSNLGDKGSSGRKFIRYLITI